jgi:hypothetical protein
VNAANNIGLAVVTGTDRTIGTAYEADVAVTVTGVRFAATGSGGTDTFDVSVWTAPNTTTLALATFTLASRASASITTSGTRSVAFGSPVVVPAGYYYVVGVRCTSSVRFTWSVALSGSSYDATAANHFGVAYPGPDNSNVLEAGGFAAGDAPPVGAGYAGFRVVSPVEPFF